MTQKSTMVLSMVCMRISAYGITVNEAYVDSEWIDIVVAFISLSWLQEKEDTDDDDGNVEWWWWVKCAIACSHAFTGKCLVCVKCHILCVVFFYLSKVIVLLLFCSVCTQSLIFLLGLSFVLTHIFGVPHIMAFKNNNNKLNAKWKRKFSNHSLIWLWDN